MNSARHLTNLQDVDLPVVHVLQELLEVLRPDVLEEDDGVLVRLPREHLRARGKFKARYNYSNCNFPRLVELIGG